MEQIKNEHLSVCINSKGAELWSIKDKDGMEYLWQGDPQYWEDRAINLFPYIARLTEGKYVLDGKTYKMDIHGFAKDTVFQIVKKTDSEVTFRMQDTDETIKQYPFKFIFEISYRLEESSMIVTYTIENKDNKTMYFGIGGHPGFNVPLEERLAFTDYYLEFEEEKNAKRITFSDDHYVLDSEEEFLMEEGRRIRLRHEMFDDDAIVLTNMAKGVVLKSDKGSKGIRVRYPNMNYLGIWHCMHTEAPYVCIEPWSSLPSRKDVIEDFSLQSNLIALQAKEKYVNGFSVELI